MTFVGKILVVLQVVLSVLFMAFAGVVYSIQGSWREKYDAEVAAKAQVQQDLTSLSAEFEQFKQTTAAADQALTNRATSAEATLRTRTQERDQLQTDLRTVRQERDALMANSDINDREARERMAEAQRQKEVNLALHQDRDQARVRIQQLEDQVFGKDVEIRRMNDKHEGLLDELVLWRRAARYAGLDPDPRVLAGQQDPPPLVYGKVLDVRQAQGRDHDFIEISLGQDDGLERGHELHVSNSSGRGKYLGKIRIVYVTPDRAVAVIVNRAKNGTIQRGDDVTTQL